MEVKERKITELIAATYNPRKLSEKEHWDITESLKRFGCVDPVIVNAYPGRENIIIGGHPRCRIWAELGHKTIPTVDLSLPEDEERELNIRLNKNTGSWDYEILKADYDVSDLAEYGFNGEELTVIGFEPDEINSALGIEVNEVREDDPPAIREKIRSKEGSRYTLGTHAVMCGDSESPEDVAALMAGDKAQMVFTDPPYGVSYKGTADSQGRPWDVIQGDNLREGDLFGMLKNAFCNMSKHTVEFPALYVCHASRNYSHFQHALEEAGFIVRQQLIWHKGMVLGRSHYHWTHEPIIYASKEKMGTWYGDRTAKTFVMETAPVDIAKMKKTDLVDLLLQIKKDSSVLEIDRDPYGEYKHPTQKPVALPATAILNSSQRDDIVLDLFGGSGSTLSACHQIGRRCRVMEKDPQYCDVIIGRYCALVGINEAEIFGGQK